MEPSCGQLSWRTDIVEAILDGRQPRNLSVLELRNPIADWDQQRRLLGFSPVPAWLDSTGWWRPQPEILPKSITVVAISVEIAILR
jgi:hypothetical protein